MYSIHNYFESFSYTTATLLTLKLKKSVPIILLTMKMLQPITADEVMDSVKRLKQRNKSIGSDFSHEYFIETIPILLVDFAACNSILSFEI